jgi:hypothetical protein
MSNVRTIRKSPTKHDPRVVSERESERGMSRVSEKDTVLKKTKGHSIGCSSRFRTVAGEFVVWWL